MRRRTFITSGCAAGAFAATTPALGQGAAGDGGAARALDALVMARQFEAASDFEQLRLAYHSDAMLVAPNSLTPSIGRAAIRTTLATNAQTVKPLYFYYRQPQVLLAGNAAIVVANYEAGHSMDGQTVEHTGKTSNVVLLGPDPPLIALDVRAPNLNAGSYGALGTALSNQLFGTYPLRALGANAALAGVQSAGGGEYDVLYKEVQRINNSWLSGNSTELLQRSNPSGVFLIGDYSPYFITGDNDIKQHFADFYKTSKVNMIRSVDPQVRIWGSVAAVAFNFDLDYTINSITRRSPGRAVYTFVRGATSLFGGVGSSRSAVKRIAMRTTTWQMASCVATHLVNLKLGDPYPTLVK